jgi:hypothetical protein
MFDKITDKKQRDLGYIYIYLAALLGRSTSEIVLSLSLDLSITGQVGRMQANNFLTRSSEIHDPTWLY